jgi:hypothetical protein
MRDALTNLLFPANQGSTSDSVDREVWSGVLRYRRDAGRNSTPRALYTGREGGGYHNRVALYLSSVPPRTNRLFSQHLFSYKLNPQAAVLVGYSDNQLGLRGIDLTRTDRTFFVKVSYAWVP